MALKKSRFLCICSIVMAVIFSGCSNTSQSDAQEQPLQRYASVTGLKPEKLEYYKQLHAAAWPAVLKKIKACNIENYSIYLKEIKGEYFLFSYFEYRGNNFKSDMAKMAADPETQRWWKETDPCQLPLDDAKAEGKIWSDMEEVFHTD